MSRNIFRPGGTAVRWLGIAWRFPSSLQDESFSVVVLQPLRSWLISSVAPRLQCRRPERSVPNAERIFFIRPALRAGFNIEEIFNLTKIDRWFLVQIKEIVDFEEELAGAKN